MELEIRWPKKCLVGWPDGSTNKDRHTSLDDSFQCVFDNELSTVMSRMGWGGRGNTSARKRNCRGTTYFLQPRQLGMKAQCLDLWPLGIVPLRFVNKRSLCNYCGQVGPHLLNPHHQNPKRVTKYTVRIHEVITPPPQPRFTPCHLQYWFWQRRQQNILCIHY